jgi:hypothetical protein
MSPTPVRRKPKPNARRQQPRRQRVKGSERPTPPFIYLVRLIVCGLGATTIAGTAISVVNPPVPPVTSKGKLPSPPNVMPSMPPKTTIFNSPLPKNPSTVPDPKKTKLDPKPSPDSAGAPGFPKSVFIKPSTIRP